MPERETHITRMMVERNELSERLRKLEDFMSSDTYESLNKFQKYLMEKQRGVMKEYLDILITRITSDKFVMETSVHSTNMENAPVEPSEHN